MFLEMFSAHALEIPSSKMLDGAQKLKLGSRSNARCQRRRNVLIGPTTLDEGQLKCGLEPTCTLASCYLFGIRDRNGRAELAEEEERERILKKGGSYDVVKPSPSSGGSTRNCS